jgi:hypothetical protein
VCVCVSVCVSVCARARPRVCVTGQCAHGGLMCVYVTIVHSMEGGQGGLTI